MTTAQASISIRTTSTGTRWFLRSWAFVLSAGIVLAVKAGLLTTLPW